MATRRKDQVVDDTKEESNITKKKRDARKLRQAPVSKEWDHWRWIAIVLVVSLALFTLYYYYNTIPIKGKPQQRSNKTTPTNQDGKKAKPSNAKQSSKASDKPSTKKDVPKETNAKKKSTKESKANVKGNGKTRDTGNNKKKEQFYKSKAKPKVVDDLVTVDLGDIPVLRRPVPPNDPDRPFIIELLTGDNLLSEGSYSEALQKFNGILKQFAQSPRAMLGKAMTLDKLAEKKQNVKVLDNAVKQYKKVAYESRLANEDIQLNALLRLVVCAERQKNPSLAIDALRKALEISPNNERYAVKLATAYLKSNAVAEAKTLLANVTGQWPNHTMATAMLGYVLYTERDYSGALPLLMTAIRDNKEVRKDAKFYQYAGDILHRLGRSEEAYSLYSEAVENKLFPSIYQRSLVNEAGLRALPWWSHQDTGMQQHWQYLQEKSNVLKSDAQSVISTTDGLFDITGKDKYEYIFYTGGQLMTTNCQQLPQSCEIVTTIDAATTCKRGETRFLLVPPHSHVDPRVGATNTRLRAVLPLELAGALKLRTGQDTRELAEGEVTVVDDSFEQEVWYEGDKPGLLLIVEFWHPDLTASKLKSLSTLE